MKIETIDDVLPHIEGREEFVVAEREGYTAIDYRIQTEGTFDHPIRLECRGIKFAPDGRILARPFHKFFNIGEKDFTQPELIDFSEPHVITEKLDGSMVHPAIVNDELRLMTRMGVTDVAQRAEGVMCEATAVNSAALLSDGFTPIFEYTCPTNRIVIKYHSPALTLLAVRHTVSGQYLSFEAVEEHAEILGVDAVQQPSHRWNSCREFCDHVRAIQGMEGFVVRFADGRMMKAKGEDYVLKHKAKEQITLEKNALALIASGQADDIKALLTPEDLEGFEKYEQSVGSAILDTSHKVLSIVESGAKLDQKTFAVEHVVDIDPALRPLAFAVRGGKDAHTAVKDMVLKNTSSRTKVENIRHILQCEYEL